MEYLGTPIAWSVFAVIALAAATIIYGVYAVRKGDETAPSFGEVNGTLKQDWTRTGKSTFMLPPLKYISSAVNPPSWGENDYRKFDGTGCGGTAVAPCNGGRSQRGCRLLEHSWFSKSPELRPLSGTNH
jgi:hypothetical protein